MSYRALSLVTFFSALGCGLIAGVFFAFSTFVMPALARIPPMQGIAAMQSINITVYNRWFMGALMGTAAACALLVVTSLLNWSAPGARLQLAASVLYLVGTIFVTGSYHVPRNNALALVQPETAAAAESWARYLAEWVPWNHIRTITSLLAAVLFTLALLSRGR